MFLNYTDEKIYDVEKQELNLKKFLCFYILVNRKKNERVNHDVKDVYNDLQLFVAVYVSAARSTELTSCPLKWNKHF